MSKCPVCKRSKCIWIELKLNPEMDTTESLTKIVDHNLSYIEMIYKDHQGSASAEERMINRLTPYTDEIEKRKVKK
jgi:hypothetical protein